MENNNQIITLYTETVIDSCHNLNGYDGKCVNQHGHSWLINIWIQGYKKYSDNVGILFDFGNIKEISEILDHKCLNDIILNMNPTAENISMWVLNFLKNKNPNLDYKVRIYETAVLKKTWAQVKTPDFDNSLI